MRERKIFAFAAIVFLAFSGLSAGALSPAPHPSEADKLDRQVQELFEAGKYCEKVLGPENPDTAISLNSLAELYRKMGDYAKAEPLHQRALKIREKTLGLDHPRTGQSLNNLALLYMQMG